MTFLIGFFTPWIIYIVISLLHLCLPGRWVTGYVRHSGSGELLKYRLNGLLVLITMIILWFSLGYFGMVPYDWLYTSRWSSLAGAFVFGLIFSLGVVLPYPSTGKPWLADVYFGRLENPQAKSARIDAKMWLYLVGAVMLQLNVLSFVAHRYSTSGEIPMGVMLH